MNIYNIIQNIIMKMRKIKIFISFIQVYKIKNLNKVKSKLKKKSKIKKNKIKIKIRK